MSQAKYCILQGDVLEQLRLLPDESVQCVVTSPPYWGLREYKIPPSIWGGIPECQHDWGNKIPRGKFCSHCGAWAGEFGLEPTIWLYLQHAVTIFREVRRVLKKSGTLWLNIGDSACNSDKWGGRSGNLNKNSADGGFPGEKRRASASALQQNNLAADFEGAPNRAPQTGIKPKDICMIPHRLAIALQEDGWYVRKDIVWFKTNAMPESVKDRPTTAHEYVFLCSKSKRYYYDAKAIMVPASPNTLARVARAWCEEADRRKEGILPNDKHGDRHGNAIDAHIAKKVNGTNSVPGVNPKAAESVPGSKQNASFSAAVVNPVIEVNARSVWPIPAQPYPKAHFATFPPLLVRPCVLAGSKPGDVVLDPFAGSGTTLAVACVNGRNAIGIEIGAQYVDMIHQRVDDYCGLFAQPVPTLLPARKSKPKPTGGFSPPPADGSARFKVGDPVHVSKLGVVTHAWQGTDEAGEQATMYRVEFPVNRNNTVSTSSPFPEHDLEAAL